MSGCGHVILGNTVESLTVLLLISAWASSLAFCPSPGGMRDFLWALVTCSLSAPSAEPRNHLLNVYWAPSPLWTSSLSEHEPLLKRGKINKNQMIHSTSGSRERTQFSAVWVEDEHKIENCLQNPVNEINNILMQLLNLF